MKLLLFMDENFEDFCYAFQNLKSRFIGQGPKNLFSKKTAIKLKKSRNE